MTSVVFAAEPISMLQNPLRELTEDDPVTGRFTGRPDLLEIGSPIIAEAMRVEVGGADRAPPSASPKHRP